MNFFSHRIMPGLGPVLIILIQLIVVAYAAWFGRPDPMVGAAAATTIAAAAAMLWFAWRRRGSGRQSRDIRLAESLAAIDLESDRYAPVNPPGGAPGADVLADAVEQLGVRVRAYREKLLVRHQRVQRLLRNVTDVLYKTDADGRLRWVTQSVTDILGYRPDEMIDRPLRAFLASPERDGALLLDSPQLTRQPVRVRCKNGAIAWLMVSSRRIDGPNGVRGGTEGIWRDGTRLIETQRALDQEKERAHVTLASIGDGVITTDAQGSVEYLNPVAFAMLGLSAGDTPSEPLDRLCRLSGATGELSLLGMVEQCARTGRIVTCDEDVVLRKRAAPESKRSVQLTISPIRGDDAGVTGTVVVLHDITRLQQVTNEMSHLANHDLVTGLQNRRAFEDRLARLLAERGGEADEHALCYIDLDQFKLVNDTCGHDAGDEMLRQIAALMRRLLRPGDTLARLGGDEFGIVMQDIGAAAALARCDQLRGEIDGFRFYWEGKVFRLGASVGLARIEAHEHGVADLLRRADTACYQAKEEGRNQVCVYSGGSDEVQTRRGDMQRMQKINDCLEHDGFALFGQVMQSLKPSADNHVGIELLLRVCGDDGTFVPPQPLLIAAERYHAAPRIDRWVLSKALALIEGAEHAHDRVDHYSINISAQSISDANFVNCALELIGESGVDPKRLVFEITETAAVSNTRRAGELIRSLRSLGCRFSLDDFGSGLSSFSNLKDLPSDFLKIDGGLVTRVLSDPVEASIVRAINQIGHAMNLKTVAEHVENEEVLNVLRQMGVDYAQGYYVGYPIAFERLEEAIGACCADKPPALVKR